LPKQITIEELQERCKKAQFAVAARRAKFGASTDDIQILFLNLARIFGKMAKLPTSVDPGSGSPSEIQTAMARVETIISSGSVSDLESAIETLVSQIRAGWEKAQDATSKAVASVEDLAHHRSDDDITFRKAFRASIENPIPLTRGPLFGRPK
jgi:hypothetical protein